VFIYIIFSLKSFYHSDRFKNEFMDEVYYKSEQMRLKKRNQVQFNDITLETLVQDTVTTHAKRIYILSNEAKLQYSIKEELDKIDQTLADLVPKNRTAPISKFLDSIAQFFHTNKRYMRRKVGKSFILTSKKY
jgi:hypothetical protein